MQRSKSLNETKLAKTADCLTSASEPSRPQPASEEIVKLVRLNLRSFELDLEQDPDCDWKAGLLLGCRIQRVLVDARILPSQVDPRIFFHEIGRLAERDDMPFDDYELIAQFEAAWPQVIFPEGFKLLDYAFALAEIDPHSMAISTSFPSEKMKSDAERLASACAHLQALNQKLGKGACFYLAQDDAARYMKCRKLYVGLLFKKLEESGTLRRLRHPVRGVQGKATVYQISTVPFGNHNDLQDLQDPK